MKRLAMAAILVTALFVPTLAGEVPTVGVAAPQPSPQPTTQSTSSGIATTVLLTLISWGLVNR